MTEELRQKDWHGIAEGKADIWRIFLAQLIPAIYAMFIKRWHNPSLAEELTQKTVFDALCGRNSYDSAKGSPKNWFFGIAKNNIALEARRRLTRPTIDGDITTYLHAIDTGPLPDEVLERKETAAIVRSALKKLKTKHQTVLRAKYIEQLSANDIARQMGITEKAVHSLLYHARDALREKLRHIEPLNKQRQEL